MTFASSTPSVMSAATLSAERSLDETSAFRRSTDSSISIELETDSMSFSMAPFRTSAVNSIRWSIVASAVSAPAASALRTVRSANSFISSVVTRAFLPLRRRSCFRLR